jgi:DNA invertase Pin-like site-specific DNA recombinase
MEKKITIIEPVKPVQYTNAHDSLIKRKVCAYVRVSTDHEEQKTSYDAQFEYYTEYIGNKPEWAFTGIYADEGISGTSTKRRKQFNQMISDAKEGIFDLILTKSISRFARNTVDCLSYIKELRNHNVEIYFEKENLYSFDNKVDFILTIMSSIAQEEARNISENIKWSVRKRFREGKPMITISTLMGYDFDENKKLIIEPEGAKIIKEIYSLFLEGYPYTHIARHLESKGIRTVTGNQNWHASTIKSILQNEKYIGDLLLQKTVTTDYLSHTRVVNDNIEPQYYIENNHEAIIDRKDFEIVQTLIQKRRKKYNESRTNVITRNVYPFSGIIFCSSCGRTLRRRHWNKGQKSEKVMLICGDVRVNKGSCNAKGIENSILEELTIHVLNEFIDYRVALLPTLLTAIKSNLDANYIDNELEKKEKQLKEITKKIDKLIDLQLASTDSTGSHYKAKFDKLKSQYEDVETELKNLKENASKTRNIEARLKVIESHFMNKQNIIDKLDPITFKTLISKMIKYTPNDMVYVIEKGKPLNKTEFQVMIKKIDKKTPILKGEYNNEKLGKIKYRIVII